MRTLAARLRAARPRPGVPIAEHRAAFRTMSRTFAVADDVDVRPVTSGGVPCEAVSAPGADPSAVCLYLHGGGYVIGGLDTHRELAARHSRALGATTLVVDYRLAPEHPAPAAIDDAVAAYGGLLATGTDPRRIVVCGESAGGGLAIAMLVRLRDAGLPLPRCAGLVSPFVDLTLSSASHDVHGDDDPLVVRAVVEEFVAHYRRDRAADDPELSPLRARLDGLPPVHLEAGTTEVLRDDARGLASRLALAGVDVSCRFRPEAIHAWTLFPQLPESAATLRTIAAFAADID